jgi:acyl carrier protein
MCIGGVGLARGYLNRVELTARKFFPGFYRSYKSYKRIYKTGDLARWLPDGNIEFLGRIDHQVKIKGFRIELGEIENCLAEYPGIEETVVLDKTDESGDKYLCAYMVAKNTIPVSDLREHLSQHLPAYMVPLYYDFLERIPLTPNGKIDQKALPEPEIKTSAEFIAPGSLRKIQLAEILSGVLRVEKDKIGIDTDFFELGGHSMTAAIIAAKIHEAFNVRMPLTEMFKTPTIRGMDQYISGAKQDKFVNIEPGEAKEFYALSSAQKRLFFIQQIDPGSVEYNMPTTFLLEGQIDKHRLSAACSGLVKRHDSFRTSFILAGEEPVQKILPRLEFQVDYYDISTLPGQSIDDIIKNFIRPFDLAAAPVLRIGAIELDEKKYVLVVDMHHIITDGVSDEILTSDLIQLYTGEKLPPLKLQYKDFSEWENKPVKSGVIKKQEEYWLKKFQGEIPIMKLPPDYDGPGETAPVGEYVKYTIPQEISRKLNHLNLRAETTLYMSLLAVYNILISRWTGQEDIIVGSPITGRNHIDFQNIIGMFVNMLTLRNRPEGKKTFREFLKEVKQDVIDVFENQDYQFDELVRNLGIERKFDKNPLFNIVLAMQNIDTPGTHQALKQNSHDFKVSYYKTDIKTPPRFDLTLFVTENQGNIQLQYRYSTGLFKEKTIKKLAEHYIEIIEQVTGNPGILLEDIILTSDLLPGDHRMKEKDVDFDF